MEQAEQIRQTQRLLHYLETKTTAMADDLYHNPVGDYTSREQAAREQAEFFRKYPLNLGLGCRAEKPGDYFVDEFSGVPILVVRGRDRVLRAFINVCRHRGANLAKGCGSGARVFSCPYHSWTYDLEGRLVNRPDDRSFDGMPCDSHGLTPLPIAERDGLIWVVPTAGAALDLDAHLAGLERDVAGYGLDGYSHYETRTMRIGMNWKLVVDTFLESYHIQYLHRKTIDPILHSNCGTFDAYGNHLRMIIARRSLPEMREQPEADWKLIPYTAIVYVLFPNTVFIVQGDHLESWHVYPAGNGVDESEMVISFYTPEPALSDSARDHWDRNFDLLMAVVEGEDFPLAEGIQRGFYSGAQAHITYGRNEPCLHHYHRSIKQALGIAA